MSELINTKEEYKNKNAVFHEMFADFQYYTKKDNNYIKHEGFTEIKIIFKLYTEVHDYKGYNYNNINFTSFKLLIKSLNNSQKRELYSFFVKKLNQANIETDKSKYISELLKLDILCKWSEWLNKPYCLGKLFQVIIKVSMFNVFSLIFILFSFFIGSTILFGTAPYKWMELWEINKHNYCDNTFLNNLINSLSYFSGLDNKMEIISLGPWGVILEIFIRISYVLIILNYCIKELLLKLKVT